MVSDFKPEMAEVLEEEIHDVDAATLQRFITADTPEKMMNVCADLPWIFGARKGGMCPNVSERAFTTSAQNAQSLLIAALEMLRLSNEEGQDIPDLSALGIKTFPVPDERKDDFVAHDRIIAKAVSAIGFEGDPLRRLLRDGGYHGLDKAENIAAVRFSFDIEGEYYAKMLKRLVDANRALSDVRGVAAHFDYDYLTIDEEGNEEPIEEGLCDIFRLYGAFGYYPNDAPGIKAALQAVADGLFTLHLTDVRTVSANGGQEERSIATGLSSLWWYALDAMRIGRLGACVVCGRPFIANNERGKKRKYCSEACKQWNKVHPGEKRRPDSRKRASDNSYSENDAPSRRINVELFEEKPTGLSSI